MVRMKATGVMAAPRVLVRAVVGTELVTMVWQLLQPFWPQPRGGCAYRAALLREISACPSGRAL
jgi:hypothetical protein